MRFILANIVLLLLTSFVFAQTGMLPEELYDCLQNQEDILILDIRADEQYSEIDKIPESINIPFEKLATELKARGLSYSKKIVVYDRTGNIGRIAVSFLKKMLYTNVYYVIGGYIAWKDNLDRIEKSIPENETVPYATTNDVVLDSLYNEIPVDSLISAEDEDYELEDEEL